MDIKEKIEEVVKKVTSDKDLIDDFKKNPVKTVEKVAGVDLPDDAVEKVVDAIKAKISVDDVKDKVSDALGSLKKLFQYISARLVYLERATVFVFTLWLF